MNVTAPHRQCPELVPIFFIPVLTSPAFELIISRIRYLRFYALLAAGVTVPRARGLRPVGQANDSQSLLPELLGAQPANEPLREQLIIQGSPASAADNAYRIDRALYQRGPTGDLWKLIVVSSLNDPLADIEWRDLYNLSVDPAEQNDRRNDPAVSNWQDEMRATYLDLIARERTVESFR